MHITVHVYCCATCPPWFALGPRQAKYEFVSRIFVRRRREIGNEREESFVVPLLLVFRKFAVSDRPVRQQVSRGEVVMTLEQAKQAKLAKGFALEPVLPGSLDSCGPLPEGQKRDRKKADIFGGCTRVGWA